MKTNYNEMSKEELSEAIYELRFAAIDLNLFLDNNPNNERAIDDYNLITKKLQSAISTYEEKYGPQLNFGNSTSFVPWAWVNEPWPWEIRD